MATMKKLFLAGCLLTMTAMPSWAQTGTKGTDWYEDGGGGCHLQKLRNENGQQILWWEGAVAERK